MHGLIKSLRHSLPDGMRDVDEIESTYIFALKMLVSCSAVCMHVPKDGEREVAEFPVKQNFGESGKQL